MNVAGIAFMDSSKIYPLQAADLFAWEYNRNAQNILTHGMKTLTTPELLHLKKGMPHLDGQITQREAIIKIRDNALAQHDGTELAQIGDYLKNFGLDPGDGSMSRERRKRKLPS